MASSSPRSRYLRRSKAPAAPSRQGQDCRGPTALARRALATRGRVPVMTPGGCDRKGGEGLEEGSRSRGRAACCGALAWRPGSQPGPGCGLGALESRVNSPFLARAESPGRTRARLGDCCILTGLPGPAAWASPSSEGVGGRCLQGPSLSALSCTTGPLLQPHSLDGHRFSLLSLYPGPLNSGSVQSPDLRVPSRLLAPKS